MYDKVEIRDIYITSPLPSGWKKYYFHNEVFINLILFLRFLSILAMKKKSLIIKSLKLFGEDKKRVKKFWCVEFMTQPHGGHFLLSSQKSD